MSAPPASGRAEAPGPPAPAGPEDRWTRAALHGQADGRLLLYLLLLLQLSRAALVLFFRGKMAPGSGAGDLLAVFATGLRFDAKVAATALLPSLLLGLLALVSDRADALAPRVRRLTGRLLVPLLAAFAVVDVGYFREYDDQFNHFLVNLLYDDRRAILGTMLAEYHVGLSLAVILAASLLGLLALRRVLAPGPLAGPEVARLFPGRLPRAAATLAALLLLVFLARGSATLRPLKNRDAAVTADRFLNKTVLNPPLALWYAVATHRRLQHERGLESFLPDGDVAAAARRLFPGSAPDATLEQTLRRVAAGSPGPAPRHIYVVLMESYDTWPLLPQYRSLRLTEQLQALGREGLFLRQTLPASDGTMKSIAAIVTGVPESGLRTSYQPAALRPYATSLPLALRRLGYRTRFFYGGSLGWERLDELVRAQGFDEIYGSPNIPHPERLNEWGVDDGSFFRFVSSLADDGRPTFNFLMTTGYHPPHSVDVYAKGYPVRDVPADLRAQWDTYYTLRDLGHLWYADRSLGEFVRGTEARLPRVLFAVTGDHAARKFVSYSQPYFEKVTVPLLLHGPEVLRGRSFPPGTVGSHHDIGATILELAAPAGFVYHALGRDLLAPAQDVAFGYDVALGTGWVADLRKPPVWYPVPDDPPATPPDLAAIKRRHDDLHGVAWWLVRNNPIWGDEALPRGAASAAARKD